MASYVDRLSGRDVATLAAIVGVDPESLALDLQRRPWSANDLLSDPAVFEMILERRDPPFIGVSPFLLFAVLCTTSPENSDRRRMSTIGPAPSRAYPYSMLRLSRNSSTTPGALSSSPAS